MKHFKCHQPEEHLFDCLITDVTSRPHCKMDRCQLARRLIQVDAHPSPQQLLHRPLVAPSECFSKQTLSDSRVWIKVNVKPFFLKTLSKDIPFTPIERCEGALVGC